MHEASTKRAFGYVRVSTEEQALFGSSLDAQKAHIKAVCAAKGWALEEVFVDAGVSGSKRLSVRPAGRALLEAVKPGDVIVAMKLDRLFRSLRDAITCADQWREDEVDLAIDDIDTTSAHGRIIFALMAALAEFEREQTVARTRRIAAHRKANGLVVGQVPMGFRIGADGQTLVEDEDELAALDRIGALRKQSLSFERIADILNREHVPKKRGGPWSRGAVHHLYQTYLAARAA